MQIHSLLSLILVVFARGGRGDEDCAVPMIPAKECCNVDDLFPHFHKTVDEQCKLRHLVGNTPSQLNVAYSCVMECSLSKEGLLTADKELDKASLTKFLTPTDASLAPAVATLVDKCFASYKAEIDPSLECKSGTTDFVMCFKRELLLNCPSSRWSASPECDQIKAKVSKCTKVPVFLMKG